MIARENGAPSSGPARYACPSACTGVLPAPPRRRRSQLPRRWNRRAGLLRHAGSPGRRRGRNLGVGASGDPGEAAGQAGRKRDFQAPDLLFALFARELQHERAVLTGDGVGRARAEPWDVRLLGRGCDARGAVRAGADGERARGRGDASFRGRPRGQFRRRDLGAARLRRDQRCTVTAGERELEVFERELRVFAERGGEPAGDGVEFDVTCELHDDPHLRVIDDDVQGDQAVERVVALGGDVHRTRQRMVEQRCVDFHRADLGRRRTSRRGCVCEADLRGAPAREPVCRGGVNHPFLRPG